MRIEEKTFNVDGKSRKAIELISDDQKRLTVKDFKQEGPNVVYTTFKGDIYKTNHKLNPVYSLLKDGQYYLDFD